MVLSIKESRGNLDLFLLDNLKQLNNSFVITEIINFIDNKTGVKPFQQQTYLLNTNSDKELIANSQFSNMMATKDDIINFCYHTTLVTLTAGDLLRLTKSIEVFLDNIGEMGVIAARHDIFLGSVFWGQFPGNFTHLAKRRSNLLINICSFLGLHNYYFGALKIYGTPIVTFFSIYNQPYFFNFKYNNIVGPTIIAGPKFAGKTTLQNFLLAESYKQNYKIIIIDNKFRSKIFVKALGGTYKIVKSSNPSEIYTINPFDIKKGDALATNMLLEILSVIAVEDAKEEVFQKLIFKLQNSAPGEKNIEGIYRNFDLARSLLGEWQRPDNKLTSLFTDKEENIWNQNIIGVDITAALLSEDKNFAMIILYYLIYKISSTNNPKNPTILLLEEAWYWEVLLYNEEIIANFLQSMKSKNISVIFTTSDLKQALEKDFTKHLLKHVVTQIFLPGDLINTTDFETFNISKDEAFIIQNMQIYDKCFFIKQGDNSSVLRFSLKEKKERYVLSSNEVLIQYMEESIKEVGTDPSNWLPIFYKKCENAL